MPGALILPKALVKHGRLQVQVALNLGQPGVCAENGEVARLSTRDENLERSPSRQWPLQTRHTPHAHHVCLLREGRGRTAGPEASCLLIGKDRAQRLGSPPPPAAPRLAHWLLATHTSGQPFAAPFLCRSQALVLSSGQQVL